MAPKPPPQPLSATPPPIPTFKFSHVCAVLYVFTINPYAKLTVEDYSGTTPAWKHVFLGSAYAWPASFGQARIRAQKNIKRYARNYNTLFLLILACSMYRKPFAFVGLMSSLGISDELRFNADSWGLDRRPIVRYTLVFIIYCVLAFIFPYVLKEFLCALCVAHTGTVLHASFRKLSPPTSW